MTANLVRVSPEKMLKVLLFRVSPEKMLLVRVSSEKMLVLFVEKIGLELERCERGRCSDYTDRLSCTGTACEGCASCLLCSCPR